MKGDPTTADRILAHVTRFGPVGREGIARSTGLRPDTVTTYLRAFLSMGVVRCEVQGRDKLWSRA